MSLHVIIAYFEYVSDPQMAALKQKYLCDYNRYQLIKRWYGYKTWRVEKCANSYNL